MLTEDDYYNALYTQAILNRTFKDSVMNKMPELKSFVKEHISLLIDEDNLYDAQNVLDSMSKILTKIQDKEWKEALDLIREVENDY